MGKKVGIGGAALGAVLFGVYLRFIRPWQLRWGATNEEVTRVMSGDDIVKHPTFNATRAVTIQARPEEIWPWLVQIGCKRAGWYSYDWIDNLGIPSANCIVPELQHLEIGDLIPFSRGPISVEGVQKGFWSVSLLLRFHQILELSSATEQKGNCPEYFYRFYPFLLCPIFTRISVLGQVGVRNEHGLCLLAPLQQGERFMVSRPFHGSFLPLSSRDVMTDAGCG